MRTCNTKEEKECVTSTVIPYNKCPPPCEGLYMDFEKSEETLREDMVAKNENFMQKYKDYTRFKGNSTEEAEESEENNDEGGYTYLLNNHKKLFLLFYKYLSSR